jgi:hypothetical protein
MSDEDRVRLKRQVQCIIEGIEEPDEDTLNDDGGAYTAYDYIDDALDIEYTVGRGGSFKGARLLVCFGGPDVWVNTQTDTVEGYWWGTSYSESYSDNIGLHEACEELWECTRH